MRIAVSNDIFIEPVGVSIGIGGDTNPSYTGDNLLSYTFDKKYISGGANASFNIIFTVPQGDAEYVAIAGHNLGDLGAHVTVRISGVVQAQFSPTNNKPLMFGVINPDNATDGTVLIEITKEAGQILIISHVASGKLTDLSYTASNGQLITSTFKGGYPRVDLGLGRKLRSTQSDQGAPMATIIQTIGQKVSLSISNIPYDFANVELLEYQKFWTTNGFFIQNDSEPLSAFGAGVPDSSYLAFNFTPTPPKTHGGTRELVNISYRFTTYNGL